MYFSTFLNILALSSSISAGVIPLEPRTDFISSRDSSLEFSDSPIDNVFLYKRQDFADASAIDTSAVDTSGANAAVVPDTAALGLSLKATATTVDDASAAANDGAALNSAAAANSATATNGADGANDGAALNSAAAANSAAATNSAAAVNSAVANAATATDSPCVVV